MTERPMNGQRCYRFARTEQGARGILWSVYEAAAPLDYKNGTIVASFVRREDALAFVQPLSDDPCRCGHELSAHTRPARVNCLRCGCSMLWPPEERATQTEEER